MKGKIQVTPTQVELELKLGCDNNSLVFIRFGPKMTQIKNNLKFFEKF